MGHEIAQYPDIAKSTHLLCAQFLLRHSLLNSVSSLWEPCMSFPDCVSHIPISFWCSPRFGSGILFYRWGVICEETCCVTGSSCGSRSWSWSRPGPHQGLTWRLWLQLLGCGYIDWIDICLLEAHFTPLVWGLVPQLTGVPLTYTWSFDDKIICHQHNEPSPSHSLSRAVLLKHSFLFSRWVGDDQKTKRLSLLTRSIRQCLFFMPKGLKVFWGTASDIHATSVTVHQPRTFELKTFKSVITKHISHHHAATNT